MFNPRKVFALFVLVLLCTLPACITGPYFPAPTILKDAANIRWAFYLQYPEMIAALSTDDAPSVFADSFYLTVDGADTRYDAVIDRRLGRREEIYPPVIVTGDLYVSGRRFVPESDFFVRYYYVIENRGATDATQDIAVYFTPFNGDSYTVVDTADGDGSVEAGETWLVATNDAAYTPTDLSVALIWGDSTSTLTPAVNMAGGDLNLTYTGVTIPAGSSITLVYYGVAHRSTTVLSNQAPRICAGLAPQCAVGFSAAEMAQIANFTFDTDGDGMGDGWELAYTYTVGVNDGGADKDGDLIPGWQEFLLNSNPLVVDSDNDKLSDRDEFYRYGTDLATKDSDGDRVTDRFEVTFGNNASDDSDGAFHFFRGDNFWSIQPSIAFDANHNLHLFCSESELEADGFPGSDAPVFVYRMLSPTGEVLIDRTVIDIGAIPGDEGPGMSAVTVLPTGRVVVTVLLTDSEDGDSADTHLVRLELDPRLHPQNGSAGTSASLVVVPATPLDDPANYTTVPRQFLRDDGTLYVVFFSEGDLCACTRQNDGTWLPPVTLFSLAAPFWDSFLDVSGRIHVVTSNGNIVTYQCFDGLTGAPLIAASSTLTDLSGGAYYPAIRVDEQGIVFILGALESGGPPLPAPEGPPAAKGPLPISMLVNNLDFISFSTLGHPLDNSTINVAATAVTPQTRLPALGLHSPLAPTMAFDSRGYIRVITHDSKTDEIHHTVLERDGTVVADIGQVSQGLTYSSMNLMMNNCYLSEAQMIFGSGRAAWATQHGMADSIVVVDALDFDGDTMDDVYEFIHFGGLDHDGLDDSDGDGFTDAEEAHYGTDPHDPTSQPPPQAPGLLGAFGGGGGCVLNDNASSGSWLLSLFPLLLVFLWPRRKMSVETN